MPEYRFDQSEDLDEYVPDDEKVTNILYDGDEEVVQTEQRETIYTRYELEQFDRSTLYEIGEEMGVELTWSGEGADSKGDMVDTIVDHTEVEE